MVDFYQVGLDSGDVKKNGKPIVNKLQEARNEDRLYNFSAKQLDKIEEKSQRETTIGEARKKLDKMAGSRPSGDVDDEGNSLSIDDKIKQVKKGDEFPYNIPIIGWICQQIELAILRSKKNKIKEEILDEIENGTLGDNDKKELGQENVDKLKESGVQNQIRGEIAKENEEDKKTLEKYGKIAALALNYAAQVGLINSELKAKMNNEFKKAGVDMPESNQALTEEQWKMLEKVVEQHKKEEQDKSKSENVEQKQEQTNKPDAKLLADDKEQQPKNTEKQTNVTPEVMQQKNGVQQIQTQSVVKTEQTQQVQTVKPPLDPNFKMPDGMQITGPSEVKSGTSISSGAIGGKGATQEVQR